MSRPSSARQGAASHRQVAVRFLFVLALAGVAVLVLATPAAAADNDTTAPTLDRGERYNVTGIAVTIADDTDVDESSIDQSDFALSDGTLRGINVSERGSNATVTLLLEERLRVDEAEVAVADGGAVTDAAGNELTNGSVTVTGMDSYVPQLREYEVEAINDTAGRIVVTTSEPLSTIDLEITGPTDARLNISEFSARDPGSYPATYTAVQRFPETGEYTLDLRSVTDTAGIAVNYTTAITYVRDSVAPVAVLDGPRHVTAGDRARFDGAGSTDNVNLTRYNWSVDGDPVGTGESVEHAFADPGTHTVTLTVVDGRDNRATATRTVTVHDAIPREGVSVVAGDGTVEAAVGAGRTNERVRVADDYGRLVAHDGVALRSLRVTHPTNETASLAFAADAGDGSFAEATGKTALAAFTVEHGDDTVAEPTFRFAVSPARLSRAGVSYADVSLYRDDGDWTDLDARVVRATPSAVVYEASAPGLSTFVVGASATRDGSQPATSEGDAGTGRTPSLSVTWASLVTGTVEAGERVVVDATVRNDGTATGTTVVGLTVGSSVATRKPVTVPAGESRRIQFAVRAAENATVAVNGTIAGELSVVDGSGSATGQTPGESATATGDESGGLAVALPDPLALWPDGVVGTVLGGVLGLVVGVYAVLKGLAIYLGY